MVFFALRGGKLVAFAMLVIGFLVGTASAIEVGSISTQIADFSKRATTNEVLAGGERALASSLATEVVELQQANDRGGSPVAELAELDRSASTFDDTLRAFDRGGDALLPSGQLVHVRPLESDKLLALVGTVDRVWASALRTIRAHGPVPALANTVARDVDAMSPSINELALDIGTDAQSQIADFSGRRTFFSSVAVLGFLLVLGAIFNRIVIGGANIRRYSVQLGGLIDRLSAKTGELFEAKRETDLIMSTVSQGLLLIDRSGRIAPHFSDEVRKIFRTDAIADRTFFELLRPLVSEKTIALAGDYFELLFDHNRSDRLLAKINPLDELEVNFPAQQGGFESRYLAIVFRRIFARDGTVARVFIAVTDSTASVNFEKKLRAIEQKKERQFGLLLSIINLDQRSLDDFTQTAREQLGAMNDALRAEDFAGKTQRAALVKRLDTLFRAAHNVRGNAAATGLDIFARDCELFEDRLRELKSQTTLGGDAFLGLVVVLSNLRQHLDELVELRATLSIVRAETRSQKPAVPRVPPANFTQELQQLASSIASTMGKSVVLRAEKLDLAPLDSVRRRAVKDVLIQLARNSVFHGIETERERVASGKSAKGTISISTTTSADYFTIEYRDDGSGIDLARTRRRLIAQGLATDATIGTMTEPQVIAAIFEPGFSTVLEPTAHAGRGMGLDIVKETILTKLDGKMNVDSHAGRHLYFRFRIPVRVLATQNV